MYSLNKRKLITIVVFCYSFEYAASRRVKLTNLLYKVLAVVDM